MKNNKKYNDARLTIRNTLDRKGFNIFLETNGTERFIMFHSRNAWLKKRINNKRLDDIKREQRNKKLLKNGIKRRTVRRMLSTSLEHILDLSEYYMSEMTA
jgi:DNA-directed RNA polymerase subunit N (RpoN/RPB10)